MYDKQLSEASSSSDKPEIITEPHEICRILSRLQSRHCFTATLDDEEECLSTSLIAINEDESFLLFDQTAPPLDSRTLKGKQTLHLQASHLGVAVRFSVTLSRLRETNAGLRLPLPARLLHQQRRSCYRVDFTESERPALDVYLAHRHTTLHARVLDLSAGGCAILIPHQLTAPLHDGENGRIVHFDLGQGMQLRADVRLRNPAVQHKSASTRCGVEFVAMPPQEQKKLERYIARRQRESIRLQEKATSPNC